jgi:hypothetical protein
MRRIDEVFGQVVDLIEAISVEFAKLCQYERPNTIIIRTKDEDSDVDRTENSEFISLFEKTVLALETREETRGGK